MNTIVLKTNIPCQNCSNSIRKTLINFPGVLKVECSVKEGEIKVEFDDKIGDEDYMRGRLIEEMLKTGRKCT